jgi:hypothetical protein
VEPEVYPGRRRPVCLDPGPAPFLAFRSRASISMTVGTRHRSAPRRTR